MRHSQFPIQISCPREKGFFVLARKSIVCAEAYLGTASRSVEILSVPPAEANSPRSARRVPPPRPGRKRTSSGRKLDQLDFFSTSFVDLLYRFLVTSTNFLSLSGRYGTVSLVQNTSSVHSNVTENAPQLTGVRTPCRSCRKAWSATA